HHSLLQELFKLIAILLTAHPNTVHITFAYITQHSRCFAAQVTLMFSCSFWSVRGLLLYTTDLRCCHRKMEHRRITD
ncbi:hypothetical protein C0J52_14940, partial [Blattella germanica]